MNIERLKSGSYRIRQTYKGTAYSVTVPYKPTKKECVQLMAEEMDKIQDGKRRQTFATAARAYIDAKSNVLSPSTIVGYEAVLRNMSDGFKNTLLSDVTSEAVQKEINEYSKTHSPKSVRNLAGFIKPVMAMYAPNTRLKVTLPQKIPTDVYIPTDDDVRRIVEAAHGTMYEVPILLACYGMRRSEICALTIDDVSGNMIRINKAKVQGSDKQWYIKTTKTASSTRVITVPSYITDKIREQGFVYEGHPNNIICWLDKVQKSLGITHFSLHRLRHYYASSAHAAGVPDEYIMAAGGWSTDNVMKTVYRHAMADKTENFIAQANDAITEKIFATKFATNDEKP